MSERWVCKRCFSDNNDTDAACQRCGLIRGAESTPTDQTTWASSGGAVDAPQQPGSWRRWIRFWWIPVIIVTLLVGYLTTARRDDAGSLASAGNVSVDELREGDCFNPPRRLRSATLTAFPALRHISTRSSRLRRVRVTVSIHPTPSWRPSSSNSVNRSSSRMWVRRTQRPTSMAR